MNTQCIATCHEASEPVATAQIEALGLTATRIAPGQLLCEGDAVAKRLHSAATSARLIFVRYLMPVDFTLEIKGQATAKELATEIANHVNLSGHAKLTIHIRIAQKGNAIPTRGELAKALEAIAIEKGSALDKKTPAVVCSVLIVGSTLYGCVTTLAQVLSSWPGGEARYKASPDQLSRAEAKLLEASEVFSVSLADARRALDLGASPGGWSVALATRGVDVTAVDPADLDPRCSKNDKITHVALTADRYVETHPRGRFELIVNDMKMDSAKSAETLVSAAHLLTSDGTAIMTIKLRDFGVKATLAAVMRALAILERSYWIKGARQLFHNRSEVTVCVEPKGKTEPKKRLSAVTP